MLKKVVSVLAVAAMMLTSVGGTVSAYETSTKETPLVSEQMQYVSYCNSDLTLSGTTATCISYATGYSGITTKIVMAQTLQKQSSSGSWSNICSWSETDSGFKGYMTRTKYSLSSGTYRLRTTFTIYSGSKSESTTRYSCNRTV